MGLFTKPEESVLRQSKLGSLSIMRKLGLAPQTIIDVGAHKGTPELYQVYPECRHILLEPIIECEPYLQHICTHLPNATYAIAAASDVTGQDTLTVTRDLQFSAVNAGAIAVEDEKRLIRNIETIRLDDLIQSQNIAGPFIIKIDVDGHELKVLEGSRRILNQVCLFIIEATILQSFDQIILFMRENSFALYDILEPLYRPLDGALWQVDLAFVPQTSILCSERVYDRASQ